MRSWLIVSLILLDRADLFDGAPVGLQVMGRRLEEEKVIGMMKAIAGALQQYTGRSQT
jgi:Asp-tRNA(Asn)/Glu-tRNA(Gln) amidotransferase A subunit family amidase